MVSRFCLVSSLCCLLVINPTAQSQTIDLLADQKLDQWVTARGEEVQSGWSFEDGALKCEGRGAGLLLTKKNYRNFELSWEWKISEGGNSGIKYRVRKYGTSLLGCEYQMLDDPTDRYGAHSKNSTASLYAIWEPVGEKIQHPAGQWNQSRIVLKGNHIQHYLNGLKMVDGRIGSRDWFRRVQESKFKSAAKFSLNKSGQIMLTEHGNPTWFRQMTITELNSAGRKRGRKDRVAP